MILYLSMDDLSQPSLLLLKEILVIGERVINSDGKVIVRQEYTNAEPETIVVFTSFDDLKNWISKLGK